jgi:hypothetical protein
MNIIHLVLVAFISITLVGPALAQSVEATKSNQIKSEQADLLAINAMKKLIPRVDERKWSRSQIGMLMKGFRVITSLSEDACPATNQIFATSEWHQGMQSFFKNGGAMAVNACWRGPNNQGSVQFCRIPTDDMEVTPERDCEIIVLSSFEATRTTKKRVAAL